jgi:putative heme degradation protein
MTPQQALQVFDNVGAAYIGKREEHVQIQTAVAVLSQLVAKTETETQSPKEKAEASTPGNEATQATAKN